MTDYPVISVFIFGLIIGAVLGVGCWELAQYLDAHVSISWVAL